MRNVEMPSIEQISARLRVTESGRGSDRGVCSAEAAESLAKKMHELPREWQDAYAIWWHGGPMPDIVVHGEWSVAEFVKHRTTYTSETSGRLEIKYQALSLVEDALALMNSMRKDTPEKAYEDMKWAGMDTLLQMESR